MSPFRRRRPDERPDERSAEDAGGGSSQAAEQQASQPAAVRAAGDPAAPSGPADHRAGAGQRSGPATGRDDDDGADPPAGAGTEEHLAGTGPWDAAAAPADGLTRADLGSLRVPAEGVTLGVMTDGVQPVAVTVTDGPSTLQLTAFAAPKSTPQWPAVRGELARTLIGGSTAVRELPGQFGVELHGRATPPGGTGPAQPVRVLGVDGPRWFLRGVLTGPAATDPRAGSRLLGVFGQVVVHRDGEPRPPGEALPLQLPAELRQQLQRAGALPAAPPADPRPTLDPFRRGPEITEVR